MTRRPLAAASAAFFLTWVLVGCGGGGALDNPPNVSNPPGTSGQKLSFLYFQRCVNPVLNTPLPIRINGNTTTNTAFDNAFNDNSTNWDVEVEVEDSFNDQSQHTNVDVALNDSFQDNDSFTAEVDANFQDQSWTNSGQYFDQNATHGGEIDMDHFGM